MALAPFIHARCCYNPIFGAQRTGSSHGPVGTSSFSSSSSSSSSSSPCSSSSGTSHPSFFLMSSVLSRIGFCFCFSFVNWLNLNGFSGLVIAGYTNLLNFIYFMNSRTLRSGLPIFCI